MFNPDSYDAFTIEETTGMDRRGEAVRFGVPFAVGEWPEGKDMGLACHAVRGQGEVRSCSWDIQQRWDDGSVRLAFCSAVLNVKAQSILTLQPDLKVSLPKKPPFDSTIPVSAVSCQITLNGEADLVNLQAGGTELKSLALHNGIFEITGEVRQAGDNSIALAVTVRNTTTQTQKLNRLRYAIDAAGVLGTDKDAGRQIEYDRLKIRREAEDRPEILQLSHESVFTDSNGELAKFAYPIGGECRQNLVFARSYSSQSGMNIAVRDFGENFPTKLSLDDKCILFDLWPEEAGTFDWPAGMSKTHEIGMTADQGGRDGGGLMKYLLNIQYPLVPTIPTKRLAILGCFPDVVPYQPKKYAKIEYWVKCILANRPRSFGFMHFGDEPNFGYTARSQTSDKIIYTNNEYDFPLIGLTEFCRTGDRLWYQDGRAAVLHMMDVDSVTASEDPMIIGGQYAHATNHGHDNKYAAPDHEWLEGLLLWHILSGDQRAFERARAMADRFVRLVQQGEFDKPGMTARRYGWPLIGLCSFYNFCRESQYLEAAGRIVEGMRRIQKETGGLKAPYWGTPYWYLDTFMIGIATASLARYHRITKDKTIEEMIISGCEDIMRNQSPEGVFYYKDFPLVRLPDPVSSTIALEALAYGYRLSGKRDYCVVGINNIEALLAMGQSGVVVAWGEEDRKSYDRGAYMKARITEFNVQWAGIAIRGLWPFLAQIENEKILDTERNPFQWTIN